MVTFIADDFQSTRSSLSQETQPMGEDEEVDGGAGGGNNSDLETQKTPEQPRNENKEVSS